MKPRDEILLSALLQCGTIDEAAKIAGISRSTIYSRLNDPAFRAVYDNKRNEALDGACRLLQAHLIDAIDIVFAIADDPTNSPQIRLNGAQILLSNALRYGEQTQLVEKVQTLEDKLKNVREQDDESI